MSTHTTLRRPQDTVQDVKSARSQALTFIQGIQLDSLAELLDQKQAEHDSLQQELDAPNVALETLLRQARDSLSSLQQRARAAKESFSSLESDVTDFHDEIYSPLSHHASASSSSAAVHSRSSTTSASSATLFETLQGIHQRIQSLTRARDLFEKLAKVEELSLIAKEQIKLPRPDPSIETYIELVQKVHNVYSLGNAESTGPKKGRLSSATFVNALAKDTQKSLTKALEAKLISTLDALNWPAKKIQPDDLDFSTNEKARAFKAAFLDICKLEQVFNEHSLPEEQSSQVASAPREHCALAISALAQPLILRFRYHFDGKRQTNRLDKPEWYFAHVLNALHDHEPFVRQEIQRFLNQGGLQQVDAMTDFVTALIKPLHRKIRASIPQLLEMPSILAHTLYQALQFDQSVSELYGYSPTLSTGAKEEWKGTADIVLGNKAWFEGWKESERKFIDDKFFEIISSPEAWHINEDYSPPTSNAIRPTNSALKVRDLFEQVTDRYRPLPSFEHRLPFFADIQIPLLDGYMQRISSATDAFETLSFGLMRAVPGNLAGMEGTSARLTNGLNGLQRLIRALVSASWMESTSKEWSEDLFFLDLWQDMREKAITDANIRAKCKNILEYKGASSHSRYGEVGMFDSFIDAFHILSERISELIVKHVVREVNNELKTYLAKRWDEASFPASLEEEDTTSSWPSEISPELISPVTVFSALLSSLASALPPLPLNRLYRQITAQIQDTLLARSVFPKIWSERGGRQFRYDAEQGWLAAAREASKGKIKKPENGLRKLLDAGLIVSLPASTSIRTASSNSGSEVVTIAKVVQVAWDDTNDAAFNEILMKLGVRELVGRKDVKNILKKRPECWR